MSDISLHNNRKAVLQVHDGFSIFTRTLNYNPTRCLFPWGLQTRCPFPSRLQTRCLFPSGLQTICVRCCMRAFLLLDPDFEISRCLLAEAHHETPYPSHYFCGRKMSSPSGVVRKPNPFVELKNFTVPFSMFEASLCPRSRGSDGNRKSRARHGTSQKYGAALYLLHVCRLQAFRSIFNLKLNLVALVQVFEPFSNDRAVVHNTSSPDGREINPKPLVRLNHLTVPFSMERLLSKKIFQKPSPLATEKTYSVDSCCHKQKIASTALLHLPFDAIEFRLSMFQKLVRRAPSEKENPVPLSLKNLKRKAMTSAITMYYYLRI